MMKTTQTLHFLGLFVLILLGLSHRAEAQQRVFINFNVQVLNETFDRPNQTWPIMKTAENVFVFDKGEYFLTRKHPITGYAAMANWNNSIEEFHLKAALRLGPSNGEQTAGLIMMASADGSQGLIVEINEDKDYRLKLITEKGYNFISGNDENGWERSFALNGVEKSNLIEIKTQNGEYDLYFNDKYVQSFDVHELFYGKFGIFIGANTRLRVDYYEVYSTRKAEEFVSVDGRNYAELVKELSQENIRLRAEVSEQRTLIADLSEGGLEKKMLEFESIIGNLERQLAVVNAQNAEMRKRLEAGGRGIDQELSNFLQSTLQTIIASNQRLENSNAELTEENKELREQLQGLSDRFLSYADETEAKISDLRRENRIANRKARRAGKDEESDEDLEGLPEAQDPLAGLQKEIVPVEEKRVFFEEPEITLEAEPVFIGKRSSVLPSTATQRP